MSIHEGHRQRLKDRFRQEGLDGFNEVNALEMLLFYCVPRSDTNPLAHRLIERFGSFSGVLDASIEELEAVEGVGHNISTFLTFIPQADRYYNDNKNKNLKILTSVAQCGEYLRPKFINRKNEMVYMVCLDAKFKVLSCKQLGEGSVNSAGVPIRRIVDVALKMNASSVILAHNHPGGVAFPSSDDIQTTIRVSQALAGVDVVLTDHLIFADGDYTSIVDSGYYRPSEITIWR
jgi:DNA repair protein RadC